jgi:signal transduction histidine kinase
MEIICFMTSQVSSNRLTYSAATPRYFLVVASLLYLGVLFTGGYFASANLCTAPALSNGPVFITAIGLLLALEQFAHRRYRTSLPRHMAIILLVTRMGLLEIVASVDCSGLARALYPLMPFIAFFTIGKRTSYGIAVFYSMFLVLKLWLFVPNWYLNQAYVSEALMFFIALVFAISMARVADEAEINRRRAEHFLSDLSLSHQKLEIYAEQVAELAATEERNRLARDIHDSLGHYLTTISVLLEKAIAFRTRDSQASEMAMLDAKRLTRDALQDIRQSVSALRRSSDVFSLTTLLSDLIKNIDHEKTAITLQIEGEAESFPKPVLICLYRVAQEALTNIQKHAAAKEVTIKADFNVIEATLSISDNGIGFKPSSDLLTGSWNNGFGLRGVRERLELVGGVLKIESSPDRGTHLRASIPKKPVKDVLAGHGIKANGVGQ